MVSSVPANNSANVNVTKWIPPLAMHFSTEIRSSFVECQCLCHMGSCLYECTKGHLFLHPNPREVCVAAHSSFVADRCPLGTPRRHRGGRAWPPGCRAPAWGEANRTSARCSQTSSPSIDSDKLTGGEGCTENCETNRNLRGRETPVCRWYYIITRTRYEDCSAHRHAPGSVPAGRQLRAIRDRLCRTAHGSHPLQVGAGHP